MSRPAAAGRRRAGRAAIGLATARRVRHPDPERQRHLAPLHDGALTLALLARYADEYDEHGEGATWTAREFVAFLELEAQARPLYAELARRSRRVEVARREGLAAPDARQPTDARHRPL